MAKKKKSTHVMAILSETGFAYLTRQAQAAEQKGGVGCNFGKSGYVRGVIDGIAAANLDLSDSPTPIHIAEAVKSALASNTEVK